MLLLLFLLQSRFDFGHEQILFALLQSSNFFPQILNLFTLTSTQVSIVKICVRNIQKVITLFGCGELWPVFLKRRFVIVFWRILYLYILVCLTLLVLFILIFRIILPLIFYFHFRLLIWYLLFIRFEICPHLRYNRKRVMYLLFEIAILVFEFVILVGQFI